MTVHDLDTGESKIIARLRPEWSQKGMIAWTGGSRNTVVYEEWPHIPFTGTPVPWVISTVDLVTGENRQIAASKDEKDEKWGQTLQPWIDWPWVVWVEADPSGKFPNLVSYDLRDGAKHKLDEKVEAISASITEGMVIYDKANKYPYGTYPRRDVFAVPIDGSAPSKKITNLANVRWPRAGNGLLTWEEQPFPAFEGEIPDGHTPAWVQPLDGSRSAVCFTESGNNTFPGKGFVVWLENPESRLFARDPWNASAEPVLLEPSPSIGARWQVFEDRVVWATLDTKKDPPVSTIYVARIVKT